MTIFPLTKISNILKDYTICHLQHCREENWQTRINKKMKPMITNLVYKGQSRRFTHPCPAVGLDLLVKWFHNCEKPSIGTEYEPWIRPLQNKVTPSHQDLPRSRSNTVWASKFAQIRNSYIFFSWTLQLGITKHTLTLHLFSLKAKKINPKNLLCYIGSWQYWKAIWN